MTTEQRKAAIREAERTVAREMIADAAKSKQKAANIRAMERVCDTYLEGAAKSKVGPVLRHETQRTAEIRERLQKRIRKARRAHPEASAIETYNRVADTITAEEMHALTRLMLLRMIVDAAGHTDAREIPKYEA